MDTVIKKLLHPWVLRTALLLALFGTAHAVHQMIQINERNAELDFPERIVLSEPQRPNSSLHVHIGLKPRILSRRFDFTARFFRKAPLN